MSHQLHCFTMKTSIRPAYTPDSHFHPWSLHGRSWNHERLRHAWDTQRLKEFPMFDALTVTFHDAFFVWWLVLVLVIHKMIEKTGRQSETWCESVVDMTGLSSSSTSRPLLAWIPRISDHNYGQIIIAAYGLVALYLHWSCELCVWQFLLIDVVFLLSDCAK